MSDPEFTIQEKDKPMVRSFCEAIFDAFPTWKVPLYERIKERRGAFADRMASTMGMDAEELKKSMGL